MPDIPYLRLNLSNSPENVLLVRQALTGFGEAVGLDPIELNDVNTAVSEACNNAVLHAYEGRDGPLQLDVLGDPVGLCVVVRDHGRGIPGSAHVSAPHAIGGIGLPVIRALSHSTQFVDFPGNGTEVRMVFASQRSRTLRRPPRDDGLDVSILGPRQRGEEDLAADTAAMAMAVAPSGVARAVVPRVLCALAARAYFTTERISDLRLLADTVVAHTENSLSASHLNIDVTHTPRSLRLRLGPLRVGHASTLVHAAAPQGLGGVLGRLAGRHEIAPTGSASETLALHLADGP